MGDASIIIASIGAVGSVGAIFILGLRMGGYERKFITREEVDKITTRIDHDMERLEDKHEEKYGHLLEKINGIYSELEGVRLESIKISTALLSLEKSLGR